MNMRRFFTIIAMAAISAACAWEANAQVVMPTWPKDFKLLPGQKVVFGIPMSAAGDIVVNARWQGAPLTVVVKNPSGQPIMPAGGQSVINPPSARLKYTVASANLAEGPVWQVSIEAPGKLAPEAAPAAAGQVSIESPPVTQMQLQSIAQSLRPAIAAELPALQARRLAPPAMTPQMLLDKARATALATQASDIAKQEAKLKTQMGTNLTTFSTTVLKSTVSPAKTINPLALKPAINLAPYIKRPPTTNMEAAKLPALLDVTPKQSMPGDQVIVSGNNLPLDKSQSEIRFIIGNGIDVPAIIGQVMQEGTVIKYQVQVPCDPNAAGPFDGQVYANIKTNGVTTNSLGFHFNPAPVATITTAAPVTAGPGEMIMLNGQNFGPNDTIYFLWGSGPAVKAPEKQYFSPQQVRVKVPDYSSKVPVNMVIYVMNKGMVNGPLYSIAMQPTTLVIDSLTNTSGKPGEPVLISGSGLRSPLEVHFVDQSGKDMISAITSADTCSVLTHVPDITGVIGDSPWKVYVKSAGIASSAKDFTFKPAMEIQLLDVKAAGAKTDSQFDGQWGENKSLDQLMDWFNAHWDFWDYGYNSNTLIAASHRGGQFWGRSGNDVFFKTFNLKNGWVVLNVNFNAQFYPNDAWAYAIITRPLTPSPYTWVVWSDSVNRRLVEYSLSYTIMGPKGVPYQ